MKKTIRVIIALMLVFTVLAVLTACGVIGQGGQTTTEAGTTERQTRNTTSEEPETTTEALTSPLTTEAPASTTTAPVTEAPTTTEEATTEIQTEAVTTEPEVDPRRDIPLGMATLDDLSENWSDFEMLVEGNIYKLPMSYEEFASYGWQLNEEGELRPHQYSLVRAKKDGATVTLRMINFSINNLPYDKCLVGGINIENYASTSGWPMDSVTIYLPGGIQYGVSGVDDIKSAYGEPSSEYEGSLYLNLTYKFDTYQEIDLYVYYESGVLEEIDMQNFVTPAGFDKGSASDVVPNTVLEYEKPSSLDEDLLSYQFMLEGEYYSVPIPIRELLAKGWSIEAERSADVVSAHDFDYVYLRNGNQSFRAMIHNNADYATIPENCWISRLYLISPSSNDSGIAGNWAIPRGITPGMAQAALEAALQGVTYEKEETDYGIYYGVYETEYTHIDYVYIEVDADDKTVRTVEINKRLE